MPRASFCQLVFLSRMESSDDHDMAPTATIRPIRPIQAGSEHIIFPFHHVHTYLSM